MPPKLKKALVLSTGLGLVALVAWTGYAQKKKQRVNRAICAYVVPIDDSSRVRLGWSFARKLAVPLAIGSGESVNVPAAASVRVLKPSSGESEIVSGPARLQYPAIAPSEPELLVSPLREVLQLAKEASTRIPEKFTVTSPANKTRYLNPILTWTVREHVSYDVAVLDPGDPYVPARIATNIRPPLTLADLETPQQRQLAKDRNYELVVREAGASTILGGARFLTTPDALVENQIPTTPSDLLAEATAAMARRPSRTGDAWLALSRLPPDWSKTEPAVRLRLRVAMELGLADELESALRDAAALH
ncbi:MAG: hypothetical protein QM790_03970 [Nibricoccus sp.]